MKPLLLWIRPGKTGSQKRPGMDRGVALQQDGSSALSSSWSPWICPHSVGRISGLDFVGWPLGPLLAAGGVIRTEKSVVMAVGLLTVCEGNANRLMSWSADLLWPVDSYTQYDASTGCSRVYTRRSFLDTDRQRQWALVQVAVTSRTERVWRCPYGLRSVREVWIDQGPFRYQLTGFLQLLCTVVTSYKHKM